MKRLHDLSKHIGNKQKESNFNTRRIQANFPLVERKLDVVSGTTAFKHEVPISSRDHKVSLNFRIKPDNCCECFPGAHAPARDLVAYWSGFGPADGTLYPATLIEPLSATGTTFNYGYGSPWFHPYYQEYPEVAAAAYSMGAGGILIPIAGIYTITFKNTINGGVSVDNTTGAVTAAVIQNGDIISSKTYSMARGNLNINNFPFVMYALCVPLLAGDIVNVAWQATDIDNWLPQSGWGNTNNSMRINLIGLGYGMLVGKVTDSLGDPIIGATVSFSVGFGGSAITDDAGVYVFYDLTPGVYSVTASATGHTSWTQDVTILVNEITRLDFQLA